MSESLLFWEHDNYYGGGPVDSKPFPIHENEIVSLPTITFQGRVVRTGEWLEVRYNDGKGWVFVGVHRSFATKYKRKKIRKAMRRRRG